MGKQKKKKKQKLAQRADPHTLYQQSVQAPEHDIQFFDTVFRELRGRRPLSLREDFCGTALLSRDWVRSHPRRTAFGVDLDAPTLAWGQRHNLKPLPKSARERVRLIEADVLEAQAPATDITCSMNFSFCVFKTRTELRSYFQRVFDGLEPDGLLISELYGGTEAIIEIEENRDVEDYEMSWDQESYNPITHETLCHIHFRFSDGSKISKAFTYDWRLWSIPEVRELLAEVGFSESRIYWERVDEDGDGTGEYRRTEEEENQETWLVYVVAAA